jgi:hypothetical protein
MIRSRFGRSLDRLVNSMTLTLILFTKLGLSQQRVSNNRSLFTNIGDYLR